MKIQYIEKISTEGCFPEKEIATVSSFHLTNVIIIDSFFNFGKTENSHSNQLQDVKFIS